MRELRSRVFVNPFQKHLYFRVTMYWLIYTVTLLNLMFVWKLVQEGVGDFGDQMGRTFWENIPLFATLALVVPWISWDAAKFSNRVVGPIYRFRKTIEAMLDHEPVQKIRLRKGDFLLDFRDDFNLMLDHLEARGAVELKDTSPMAHAKR